ncbi:toll-like receptor 13 [Hoplias malabaricus]|uniref:toll-like receptor 13 n=1 Tax=Hoplias malabaricus TaxID=27720 RepID=UPI0034618C4E
MEVLPSFCTSLLLLLPYFVLLQPVNGFFVNNCHIIGSLKHPVNLIASCNKRELHAIPLHVPEQTEALDLSNNRLQGINNRDLIHLSKLRHLNVSHNQILDIEVGAFRSLSALQDLNLASNNLTGISEGSFENLFNLTMLRLDENQITNIVASVFTPLSSLVMLNLSGNHLSCIYETQALFHLPKLQELHIGQNEFASFQSSQISNAPLKLKVLDLSQNPLQVFRITEDIFPYLESLSLAFSIGNMTWDVQDANYLKNVSTLNLTGIPNTSVLQTFNTSLTNVRLNQFREQTVEVLIKASCQISTLKTLHLQNNRMESISEEELKYCTALLTLDLSENHLSNITNLAFSAMRKLKSLNLSKNKLNSVPTAIGNLSSLGILDLSYNSIDQLICSDFKNLTLLHTLKIYRNPLTVIKSCTFQNLNNLKTLIISSSRLNFITTYFKGCLPKLEFLDLSQNKLNSIHKGNYGDLNSLTHLLLNDNQIIKIDQGAFEGLRNLKVLNLQSNKITQGSLDIFVFSGLGNLKTLLLNRNYLSYSNQVELSEPPFTNLKSLETLEIHSQGHRGMISIPSNLLKGLTSLQVFMAGNLNLNQIDPTTFSYCPRLRHLDLSRNELTPVSPELFTHLQRLERLSMSSTGLQSLDFLVQANLTEIRYLQISKNALVVLNETMITLFSNLMYIDLQGNTFSCDCSNAWFVDWAKTNNDTQVLNADHLTCNYPSKLRGNKLMDLQYESCIVDIGFFSFISTSILIILIMLGSVLYHFLKWQVVYAYYRLLALLYDSKQQRKERSSDIRYDAFISYNTNDELWVMSKLLPQLEEEQGWRLCLHHRDFQPGKPIMENIIDGIYSSRKTICVISRRYLESEWCSREIQVASLRLFDEKNDVLIMVFLENIPAHQLSPYYRMRKLIKKRTYLSWPKPGEDTRCFWQKLRVALETKGTSEEENYIFSGLKGI